MIYLRAGLIWFNFLCLTLMLFVLLLLVVAYCRLFRPHDMSHAAHWVATLWGRGSILFSPGWSYSVRGKEHLPRNGDKPVVIIANHQSAADILAVYLTGAQFRWLSKHTVFKTPILGPAMRWAGYIPIRRGDKESHNAALRASYSWIRNGVSMVFFPEGTRSENGQLKEFKSGAFRIAVDEKVAILPVVIRGTRGMVQKNTLLPRSAHLHLEILPPVFALDNEDAEAFTLRVRDIMGAELAKPLHVYRADYEGIPVRV
ncbi:MAG: lysophospholipid acyltransferase family protein [Oligoflexus sp.]|jgi:1-acyl-sn-glycerol-3-phosphate acyltransferase